MRRRSGRGVVRRYRHHCTLTGRGGYGGEGIIMCNCYAAIEEMPEQGRM